MNAFQLIDNLAPVLIKGLNPLERLESAGRAFRGGKDSGWSWVLAIVLTLLGILAVLGVIHAIQEYRRRVRLRSFNARADRYGLSDEERSLLQIIATGAGVRGPEELFDSNDAFRQGMMAPSNRKGAGKQLGKPLAQLCGSCARLFTLREKLGFTHPHEQDSPTSVQVGVIARGTTLTILRQESPASFEAASYGQSDQGELLVEPETDIACYPGQSWIVRYGDGGVLWEFDAWVSRQIGVMGALTPTGSLRWINRRRFERIPTNRRAYVAKFPFQREAGTPMEPEFVAAEMTEIAGPGVQLRAPIRVHKNERVLIVFELHNDTIMEGAGVVRHVRGGAIDHEFAVELLGLTTSQIADLVSEGTAMATQNNARPETSAKPATMEREG